MEGHKTAMNEQMKCLQIDEQPNEAKKVEKEPL